MTASLSIIIPARNEAKGLASLLPKLRAQHPDAEIIVVNDASTDDTAAICRTHQVDVISHPYSMGNGASVKTGARAARGETLVLLDGDGQHDPEDIPKLMEKYAEGFDMVVGARHASTQASIGRWAANTLYTRRWATLAALWRNSPRDRRLSARACHRQEQPRSDDSTYQPLLG